MQKQSSALTRYILRQGNKLSKDNFLKLISIQRNLRGQHIVPWSRPVRQGGFLSKLSPQTLSGLLRKYNNQIQQLPKNKPILPKGSVFTDSYTQQLNRFEKREHLKTLIKRLQQAYKISRRNASPIYRDMPDLLQSISKFKPVGKEFNGLPHDPKQWLYGAKNFQQFTHQYSSGDPLWFSQFPQVAQDYLAGKKKFGLYDVIVRLKRPGLKHQGFRPISTAQSGIGSYAQRIKIRKNGNPAYWSHGQFTGHPQYQTVIDNTSGPMQNIIDSIFGKKRNGNWVALDWKNPVQTNKLKILFDTLK